MGSSWDGVLIDTEIGDALKGGQLFRAKSYDPENIRECSYRARLSNKYQVVKFEAKDSTVDRVLVQPQLDPDGRIVLPAGQTALVYFVEQFALPDNVMAITVPRGELYAQGLVPGVSYVDPGYSGEFWMPITNLTEYSIRLDVGMDLARVFFVGLANSVGRPFDQHHDPTIVQELDRRVVRRSADELASLDLGQLLDDIAVGAGGGNEIAEVARRLNSSTVELGRKSVAAAQRKWAVRTVSALATFCVVWPVVVAGLFDDTWRPRLTDSILTVVGTIATVVVLPAASSTIGARFAVKDQTKS